MLLEDANGAVQPVQLKVPFARLHRAPREFADPSHVQMRMLHHLRIDFPSRLRPLLRIPIGADEQSCLQEQRNRDHTLRCRSIQAAHGIKSHRVSALQASVATFGGGLPPTMYSATCTTTSAHNAHRPTASLGRSEE